MPISSKEAQQLSTMAEWTLVKSGLATDIRALPQARLKNKILRARTLRDKYRDLAKKQFRQTRAARTGKPNESRNARTKRKALLFAEVLARLVGEVSRRGDKAKAVARAKTAKARVPKKKVTPKVPSTKVPGSHRKLEPKSTKPEIPASQRSGEHRIHAHVSSAGRRAQGRRDSR